MVDLLLTGSRRWLFFILGFLLVCGGMALAQSQDQAPLYALPGSNVRVQTSGSMQLAEDGRIAWTANMINNTVSLVDLPQQLVIAEIPVGRDPRGVALMPDGNRAVAVNRVDGTLSIINADEERVTATLPAGILPFAVLAADDDSVYVTSQGTDELLQVALADGRVLRQLALPDFPAGMALWGDFLYISHLWSGALSLVYVPDWSLVRTVSVAGEKALSPSVALDPRNGRGFLPQSRSYAANPRATYDSRIFPMVNVINLSDLSVSAVEHIALDMADRPVNMPFTAIYDSIRDWVYVANAGSNDISIIDLSTNLALANIPVGANPRALILNRDNSLLYVHNAIDGSITIIEPRTLTVREVFPVSDLSVSIDLLIGAQLFYSADDARLSQDNWMSCANCHFDGLSDGRVWQDWPGGARNTPLLFDLLSTAPYTWTGAWDEVADVEVKIRSVHAGLGLSDLADPVSANTAFTGLSFDLDTLVAYVLALPTPTAPERDGAAVEAGREVFEAQRCSECHIAPSFTDGLLHDVGTGGEFNTPSLNWLWLSAPYFHDGRAAALQDVFVLPGAHQLVADISPEELNALVEFLYSLPPSEN